MTSPLTVDHAEVEVRVRYCECDPMNVAHHSVYPIWMEIARTELLRQCGAAYRDLEASGIFFVVARLSVRYQKSAHYDDVLRIVSQVAHLGGRATRTRRPCTFWWMGNQPRQNRATRLSTGPTSTVLLAG